MARKEKCAIFDIDNTIFDARERFYLVIKRFGVRSPRELPLELQREFWKEFINPHMFHLDRPISRTIEMVLDAKRRGLKVVLVTGRYESVRRETELQLRMAGIPFDKLIMRPDNNFQRDKELKPFLLREVDCEPVEYHDDDPETLAEIKKMYPNAIYFLHRPDGTFSII